MRALFLLIFVVTFGMIGCGKSPEPNEPNSYDISGNVDFSFKSFIKSIKEILNSLDVSGISIQKIDLVSINYKNINDDADGICNIESYNDKNGKKIITSRNIFMDLSKWNRLSDEEKKALLAHELGHCAWGLNHLTFKNQIMSPIVTNINKDAWIYFANQIKNVSN